MSAVLSLSHLCPASLTPGELVHQVDTDSRSSLRELALAHHVSESVDFARTYAEERAAIHATLKGVAEQLRAAFAVYGIDPDREVITDTFGRDLYHLQDALNDLADDIDEIELPEYAP